MAGASSACARQCICFAWPVAWFVPHLRSGQRGLLQSSLQQMSTLLGRLCAHWKSGLLPRAGYCPTLTDSAYTWGQGTSFATPHVAGVAAM